jgi:hypothetical protein
MQLHEAPTDGGLELSDIELELLDDTELDETVYGLPSVLLGRVIPKPYPINIYNFDGRKESGIAGTLRPDGTFVALPQRNLPRASEHWDEVLAAKVPHTGTVELSVDPELPSRRLTDASISGPWPISPPRWSKPVNPERAREAALEDERDRLENDQLYG